MAIEDPNNFRPISNLPFLAMVLEKVVFKQLQAHITVNSVSEPFQSGFKSCHSTETVLVKVLNDIFVSLDNGDNVILILLDLSAAFDMVDHEILINRLEHWVALKGNVLKLFKSYLTDRFFLLILGAVILQDYIFLGESHKVQFLLQFCSPFICYLQGLFFANIKCHSIATLMIHRFICL